MTTSVINADCETSFNITGTLQIQTILLRQSQIQPLAGSRFCVRHEIRGHEFRGHDT